MKIVVVSIYQDGMDALDTFRQAWDGNTDEQEALIKTLSEFTEEPESTIRQNICPISGPVYGLRNNEWLVASVFTTTVRSLD